MTTVTVNPQPQKTKSKPSVRTPRLDFLYEKILELDDFTAQTNFLKAQGWHLVAFPNNPTEIPRRKLPDRRIAWLWVETTPDQHFQLVDIEFQP